MPGEVVQAHRYQQNACNIAEHPILNAACKEDPAKLGVTFNAINLDITSFCHFTNKDLTELKNYVQGDVLALSSQFPPETFKTVVLGEFLEHCVWDAAFKALTEIRIVLADDGVLVVTYPLDDRPKEVQHAADKLVATVEGETGHDITTWHQTVWEDEKFNDLIEKTGWRIEQKSDIQYGFVARNPGGYGMLLKKRWE